MAAAALASLRAFAAEAVAPPPPPPALDPDVDELDAKQARDVK